MRNLVYIILDPGYYPDIILGVLGPAGCRMAESILWRRPRSRHRGVQDPLTGPVDYLEGPLGVPAIQTSKWNQQCPRRVLQLHTQSKSKPWLTGSLLKDSVESTRQVLWMLCSFFEAFERFWGVWYFERFECVACPVSLVWQHFGQYQTFEAPEATEAVWAYFRVYQLSLVAVEWLCKSGFILVHSTEIHRFCKCWVFGLEFLEKSSLVFS